MKPLPRSRQAAFLVVVLTFFLVGTSSAATVTYGANNRPVSFNGIAYNGTNYEVTVTWGSSYNAVYSAALPRFLNDEPGAHGALLALMQALVDDGYTQADVQSFLNVPYSNNGSTSSGWAVDLYFGPQNEDVLNALPYNFYSNIGYTVWTIAEPVDTEPATWGRIKALFER